jgi:YVTN family beta-propeller protein
MTPGGAYIYVANGNAATVSEVRVSTGAIVATVLVGLLPTAVAMSPDGTTVYVANAYGYSLSEIATATNNVTFTLPHVGIYPVSIAIYP